MRKDGTFVEHPECDGSDALVLAELKCSISMSSLLEADFYLVEGDEIKATVEAMNSINYSIASPTSGEALV
jgi:hypothetical protein